VTHAPRRREEKRKKERGSRADRGIYNERQRERERERKRQRKEEEEEEVTAREKEKEKKWHQKSPPRESGVQQ